MLKEDKSSTNLEQLRDWNAAITATKPFRVNLRQRTLCTVRQSSDCREFGWDNFFIGPQFSTIKIATIVIPPLCFLIILIILYWLIRHEASVSTPGQALPTKRNTAPYGRFIPFIESRFII